MYLLDFAQRCLYLSVKVYLYPSGPQICLPKIRAYLARLRSHLSHLPSFCPFFVFHFSARNEALAALAVRQLSTLAFLPKSAKLAQI
jgi:hypothetical protein